MTYLIAENVSLDIPIVDASKGFRGEFLARYAGGRVERRGGSRRVVVHALRDIDLDLRDGDRLGLIGHNGSGKTTLLRTLAGIYQPSEGRVMADTHVTPLLNPNVGLEMDETGYDNIINLARFHGMNLERMRSRFDRIAEFSELGEYLRLPVRTYSAGMQVRLSFSILMSLEPRILLIDEGIGAADAHFSTKAAHAMREFCRSANILVLATHSGGMIRELCNRAIMMDHGRVVDAGSAIDVMDRYDASVAQA